jgi:hypothetical protein
VYKGPEISLLGSGEPGGRYLDWKIKENATKFYQKRQLLTGLLLIFII